MEATTQTTADVCLFLEGTYPYVSGGVSAWTHELIKTHPELTFHIVSIIAPDADTRKRYELPSNVLSHKNVFLSQLKTDVKPLVGKSAKKIFKKLELPLLNLLSSPSLDELQKVLDALKMVPDRMGQGLLLNSEYAWTMLVRMYNATMGTTCFLDYFWSWRSLMGGLYSVLLEEYPDAKVYHSLCTGYAGLMLSRAKLETGRPCLLTEHGIYTNERRIEIASADWLHDQTALNLNVERSLEERTLRDFWLDSFRSYSKICYEACNEIITLYKGNFALQLADGADRSKMHVIPNGIDVDRFAKIDKVRNHEPTIALIGRVVPIKDIKTFLRTVSLLNRTIPELTAYIIGPTDENEEYYEECVMMMEHYKLGDTVKFTGKVDVADYLAKIDVMVLTSISESQPLSILEACAAGVPCVTTNVGACSEMLLGRDDESPKLGAAGIITPLANPKEIAEAIEDLLTDMTLYESCQKVGRERTSTYYRRDDQRASYQKLYGDLMRL